MRLDPKLKEFGNEMQAKRVDAVNEFGSFMKAGKALGVSETAIKQSIDILKRNAALQGYSPEHDMNRLVPQGFKVKGVSTYYNAEGKPSGQWVKSSADEQQRQQIIKETFEAMADELPRVEPSVTTNIHIDALCNLYV